MNISILRKLARSIKYQMLYIRSKEMSSIKLFNNDSDFTSIQLLFLYWLEIYAILYADLASKNRKNQPIYIRLIDEDVIEDDLRADAYLLWRNKNMDKENLGKGKSKDRIPAKGIPSVIFK